MNCSHPGFGAGLGLITLWGKDIRRVSFEGLGASFELRPSAEPSTVLMPPLTLPIRADAQALRSPDMDPWNLSMRVFGGWI